MFWLWSKIVISESHPASHRYLFFNRAPMIHALSCYRLSGVPPRLEIRRWRDGSVEPCNSGAGRTTIRLLAEFVASSAQLGRVGASQAGVLPSKNPEQQPRSTLPNWEREDPSSNANAPTKLELVSRSHNSYPAFVSPSTPRAT